MKRILCAVVLAMLSVTSAYADSVKVSKAWARATAPGQDSASIQMVLTSKKGATLIGVASGSANSAEIHSMVMEGNVMKMRAVESLPLPAGKPVALGEDGYHLMLIGLRKPLTTAHKLPFALTVKTADGKTETIRALAVVKPLETASEAGQMQMNMQSEGMQHEHHHH